MANLWDDLIKWLEDTSKVVGKEAGDLTTKGKLKVEIFELNRKLRDYFAELGSMIYESVFLKKNDRWRTNSKIKTMVRRIQTAQRQIKKKQLEYKKVGKLAKKVKKSKRR
ncbi:hypothetical protein AMJ52_00455 [candidate division TA06 bacterium DG_78]|uniref:Uncharacterized protein n=1 Tax=candidate division TA06 bacterium DG_78 TaxID=1703772 RepID=A0A0S7YIC2_UNCT6|nr:MAG: hypothetical protein AMJ52_00455 [candidate division TA06 bacterium DG_78]